MREQICGASSPNASHGVAASAVCRFYAGHLVLDGRGDATFDDGLLRVHADRIIVDLRSNRYIAAGSVTVQGVTVAHGDAMGVDLNTHRGVLVDTASQPSSELVDGAVVGGPAPIGAGDEPLALPDVGFEQPYIRATRAVAHLGADVRMANAHIIVPGGESVGLPSYVYTFSNDPGYSTSNLSTSGEDVPIYFGSTANSIQGIHFSYNSVTKVAIGLDSHFVYGEKAYILVAAAPIFGPTKAFNFTWQEHINDRASQTFESTTVTGVGTNDAYDLRNSIHRSYLELTADQGLGAHQATFAWQSFDQPFGSSGEQSSVLSPAQRIWLHARARSIFVRTIPARCNPAQNGLAQCLRRLPRFADVESWSQRESVWECRSTRRDGLVAASTGFTSVYANSVHALE